MKAMILAAGLGTRLRPLTFVRPKVLVPIMGTTILEFWVDRLAKAGCTGVVVNAYQLHEQLTASVQGREWPIPVEVHVEPFLLGTGGGIRNVLDFLGDEPYIVVNGDVICNAPLRELYSEHVRSGAKASLLLHDFPAFNNVAVDGGRSILGFGNEARDLRVGNNDVGLMAFTGIHFINPGVLDHLPATEFCDILTPYRDLIRKGDPPCSLHSEGLHWREMGSLEAYFALHHELTLLPTGYFAPVPTGSATLVHPDASLAPSVNLKGTTVIGKSSHVGAGASLEDVIVWDNALIEEGSRLCRCVVADNERVSGLHTDEVLVGDRE